MSQTLITERFSVGGSPANVTSCIFCDPTGTIGVQRTDTGANVVAPGTALNNDATGVYDYSITDPAPGLTYLYWITFVSPAGVTMRYQKTVYANGSAAGLPIYLSAAAADALAAQILPLRAWPTANDSQKTLAIVQATSEIDNGQIYQGRKFHRHQCLQFPRMAYEAVSPVWEWDGYGLPLQMPLGWSESIWDWDRVNHVAIVPNNVLLAVLYQADSILVGDREERLAAQHDGVSSQGNSGIQESYRPREQNPGFRTGLCRRSYQLLEQYRVRAARII